MLVLYVILVNLESHVLAPLRWPHAGLPPVAILLALLAGVELLGILGAVLAVPSTVSSGRLPKSSYQSGKRHPLTWFRVPP